MSQGFVESEEIQFKLPEGISVAGQQISQNLSFFHSFHIYCLFTGKSWGDNDATINIIAVHGFLDSAASFDRLAPLLVQNSNNAIRVIAIDLSGHGKSSHRPDHTTYFTSWITEGIIL